MRIKTSTSCGYFTDGDDRLKLLSNSRCHHKNKVRFRCAQLVGYVKLFSSNGRNSTADYVDSSTLFVSRPNVCRRVRNNETSGEIHISVAVF